MLLSKRRAWGYGLAPVLLTGLVLIAVGIVTLMAVLEVRDVSAGSWAIAAVIGLILRAVALRFLRGLDRATRPGDVLRTSASA